jgi:4-amino-4-deoxychorismate lyase
MYPYLETIKLLDGEFFRLKYHQQRMDRVKTSSEVFSDATDLKNILQNSDYPHHGLYKCRFLYGVDGYKINFEPYSRRKVESLKLIQAQIAGTTYKSADRSEYQKAFELRGDCDDVLIVCEGMLTDTSYANIALHDGKDWLTPRKPLIQGTNRAMLLEQNVIKEADIRFETLSDFQKIRIFNAMIEFGEIELSISKITI